MTILVLSFITAESVGDAALNAYFIIHSRHYLIHESAAGAIYAF